ncbi:MAG TPA: hypothetical protein VFP43_01235, partial [Mesorhizobium sp.]|nr:hypothetical protein [Mesorhizobium sp.]
VIQQPDAGGFALGAHSPGSPAMLLGVGYLTRQQGAQIPALAQVLAVAGAASCVAALIQAKPWA